MAIAWPVWHIMNNGKLIPETISRFIISFASFPSNVYNTIVPTSVPYNIFDPRQITDTSSLDGVQLFADSASISPNKFMITTFNSRKEIEIRLMSFLPNTIYKIWKLNEDKKIIAIHGKINIRAPHHPLMLKDSSIILHLNFSNAETALVRIDKFNKLKWVDSSNLFHHSIELENDSTIWTSSRLKEPIIYKVKGFLNDAICAIDPRDGKIKFMKSVADILVENGYEHLLNIGYDEDGIHLNDIQPAPYSSKYWENGDLLISLRNRNIVALYRPSNNKIMWLKTGPWLAQHDCDFVDGKTIMIFGNDVLWDKNLLVNGHNDIYFYDFEKDQVSKPYNKLMKEANIKTKTGGRSDLLKNGDLFIDESANGKIYIIDKEKIKMIYIERFDKNHIKLFNWVRPVIN